MSFNGWREVTLSDVIQFNPRETIKKGKISKKIGMDKLEPFTRKINGYEEVGFTSGTKFRNGDTLLARITPCLENGKTAQVSILEDNEIAFGSTEFIVMREKEGKTINNFIYYLSISENFRNIAIKSMTGTSGRQRAQKDVIENSVIKLPPIEEQKAIAKILSDLDNKIEVNNKINQRLEEMAQSIFKHWFVDFEFPNEDGKPYKSSGGEMVESELGMIPKGWEIKKVSTIIDVRDGTHASPKAVKEGYPLVTSKHIKGNRIEVEDAKLISEDDYIEVNKRSKVDSGDVLISMIGTVGLTYLVQEENINFAIKNIGLFKLSQNPKLREYIYLYLESNNMKNYIEARLAGTTQKYISLGELRNIPVILPPDQIIDRFKNIVVNLIDKKRNGTKETERLSNLINALLPKLMSGEIRVARRN